MGVTPLFRVPSCVIFTKKTELIRALPAAGLTGLSFAGRLPSHNCHWVEAAPKLIRI